MLVAVLVAELALVLVAVRVTVGLGLDDDVHPAIITVAPAITTSTKITCFFISSLLQAICVPF